MSEEEDLHQPHDKLFKHAFGVPENAAGFLQAKIPSEISGKLDWKRLNALPGSFVDPRYADVHMDLLFSVPVAGRETFLYVLFEHQSTRDRWLSVRLLNYMVNIWKSRINSHPDAGKLPPILPVVLSQNAEIWEPAPRLSELVEAPPDLAGEMLTYIPDFTHLHLQLAEMDFDDIPGTPSGVYVLRTMKAERLQKLLDDAVWDEALLAEIPSELLRMALRYILNADIDRDSFLAKVEGIRNPKVQSNTMTLAEQFRQEGRQEGIEEGKTLARQSRQEGLCRSILDALEIRFDRVPEGLREAIREVADEDKLRSLHRESIRCPNLEVFAEQL